jgi:hypothetical protein
MLDARARRRRGHRLRAWAAAGALGAFVALWYVAPDVQQKFCEGWTAPVLQWSGQCAEPWQRVTATDAQAAIDGLLSRAGGAQPEAAWATLGPDARRALPREDFLAEWDDVALAERSSPLRRTAGRFNWFTFEQRTWRVTERTAGGAPEWGAATALVEEARMRVRLVYSGGQVVVADLGRQPLPQPAPARTVDLALGSVTVPALARVEPDADADPSAPPQTLGPGTLLRVLCRLGQDAGGWYATPLGWLPAETLALSEVPASGVLACSPHPSAEPPDRVRPRRN